MEQIRIETIDLTAMGKTARAAARKLAQATTDQKNAGLLAIADALTRHEDAILTANAADVSDAQARGTAPNLIDRLTLKGRLAGIINDVRSVATLPDPVGEVIEHNTLENGLNLRRVRTSIGVLGIIYEARPNVTVDVAALCIKTANGVIMRGGSEMLRTATELTRVIQNALAESGLPPDAVQLIESKDRALIGELLRLNKYVDMIIPRGGADLHKFCVENSTIPVITGGVGICHLFVDESADFEQAIRVIQNAKTSRPSVCNSLDTILVHEKIAAAFIPQAVEALGASGVQFKADPAAAMLTRDARVGAAEPGDWDTEWMNLTLGIRVIDGLDSAIDFINDHSLGHSDGILTKNTDHAQKFVQFVDSSAVFVNASTRFNDGGQFGLGAEIAVSTQKLHARGPMGLRELTSYKWVVEGNGQVRG
jgi:glutamate-5-semialdehyde dehydrogenase